MLAGSGVLQHDHPPLVVSVHKCESITAQFVKKFLLGLDIIFKGLVIVEVIVSNVGKQSPGELKTCNPLLVHGMRTDLHKCMSAARSRHLFQQLV